jgi:hypothetical protein
VVDRGRRVKVRADDGVLKERTRRRDVSLYLFFFESAGGTLEGIPPLVRRTGKTAYVLYVGGCSGGIL